MTRSIGRAGSALAGLLIFLAIVSGIVMAISWQSTNVRRATTRSHYGFEAIEIAESAINEAAAQVVFGDIFDPGVFNPSNDGYTNFFVNGISEDDEAMLNGISSYKFFFRDVKNSSNANVGRIFVSMRWPISTLPTAQPNYTGFLKKYPVAKTREYAGSVAGFHHVDDVNMSVLSWRRDWVPPQWQDWGVLHYRALVVFDDGKVKLQRALHVDRLFSIYAHTMTPDWPADDPPDPVEAAHAGDINYLALHLIKSKRNLKTVILAQ